MADKTFAAFFSYVHDDDTHDNGRITKLRQTLEEEVRALSGEDFEIFQDYEDIHWGQKWEERLNGALDGSTFLISVVTPRYLRKEFCRKEVLRFSERENQLNRNDLLLSIYYIDTNFSDTNDPVVSAISTHQYFDWRDLRHEPYVNPEVSKRIEKMAREIITAMKRDDLITNKTARASEKTSIIHRPAKRVEPPTLVVDPMPRRGDYVTITKAIEAAKAGTRILIRPGLYQEAIKLEKPLELIGDGERDDIIIETSNGSVIHFNTEFGRVSNLKLRQKGEGEFYCVDISQGRLELEDCDITSDSLSCIGIYNGADPRLRRNRIHNSARSGICIFENGRGTFENNEIYANRSAGVFIETGGDPTLRHNRIFDGRWGIIVRSNGKGHIEDNEIFHNTYAGVDITKGGKPTIRRNRINNNKRSGIHIRDDGGGSFDDNDLRGNKRPWNVDKRSQAYIVKNDNIEW